MTDGKIDVGDAYAATRMCLSCARGAETDEERLSWLWKALGWRELARMLRRNV